MRISQAVHALARMPSPIVSSNLAKTVLVTNYFYRVRMEAALALVAVSALLFTIQPTRNADTRL